MKFTITEFRDMVAEAVRRTVREAKKAKDIPPRSEESVEAQRERQVRSLPGYTHGQSLDMSKPLGKKNLAKRQGAANMGNWTSESVTVEGTMNLTLSTEEISTLIRALHVAKSENQLPADQVVPLMQKLDRAKSGRGGKAGMVDPAQHGLDDPSELGMEQKTEAVRALVRMIVDEEVRVRRGR